MAKARSPATKPQNKPQNRRGSPEAIEKRKAARLFNDVLGGRAGTASRLDGRTEKRRQRLLTELETGMTRGQRELKPLDVLQHVQELLELGESLGAIKKVAKPRKPPAPAESLLDAVERLHKAYGFRPEAYRFLGIGEDVLRDAGVLPTEGGRKSKASPKRRG
jgi:hypothetical protein